MQYVNYMSLGKAEDIVDSLKGAFNPDDPLFKEHWMVLIFGGKDH